MNKPLGEHKYNWFADGDLQKSQQSRGAQSMVEIVLKFVQAEIPSLKIRQVH